VPSPPVRPAAPVNLLLCTKSFTFCHEYWSVLEDSPQVDLAALPNSSRKVTSINSSFDATLPTFLMPRPVTTQQRSSSVSTCRFSHFCMRKWVVARRVASNTIRFSMLVGGELPKKRSCLTSLWPHLDQCPLLAYISALAFCRFAYCNHPWLPYDLARSCIGVSYAEPQVGSQNFDNWTKGW
jgi:hypothetical protein